MQSPRFSSYEEFWPFYVAQHLDPVNRALHLVGTTAALGFLAAGVFVSPAWWLGLPFAGYGPAWVGHFFVEKNKPATFTYPLWSLLGDFQMCALTLTGRMDEQVARARELYPAGA